MARIHLFEFEDLSWFPKSIRDYGTDFLQFVANSFDFYKGITPILKKGLNKSGGTQIIDLASGGSGGWMKLSKHLKEEVPGLKIKLTDYYPNVPAFERTISQDPEVFSCSKTSTNALDVPSDLRGLRTQFLSFHHFRPKDAQQILQNAVDNQQPIAIFEAQERSVKHFLLFFFSPINVLLTTPFIRPFRFGRLLFTYIIPIVPLFVWWDGLVSVLRTYSVKEMTEMSGALENSDSFEWEIGKDTSGKATILYLLGTPK